MKKINLLGEWIKFVFESKNAHGIHSPFVFNYYNSCVKGKISKSSDKIFTKIQKELFKDNSPIHHRDLGAGSKVHGSKNITIKQLAKSSLKKKKEAGLISKTIGYLGCKTVVELGTSFGTTTLLITLENPDTVIYTIEGSPEIAKKAKEIIGRFPENKIHLITGSFEEEFPSVLSQIEKADAYIFDGNHRLKPTLEYFELALRHSKDNSVFIFDDIRWSSEMLQAWQAIENHSATTLTLDLFDMGIAFINTDFSKQNLKVRGYL